MFYSQSLLGRKGPLGTIWIAAYCCKKLKKEQVAETDISSTVDKIIPEDQISYRVLAHLLLGVVRIFSRKVDYLYHDCNEVLASIWKLFVPPRRNISKRTTCSAHYNISLRKGAIQALNHNVHLPEQPVLESRAAASPKEAMCASYQDVMITIPKKFALDSFDLEVFEESDNLRINEPLMIEDAGEDAENQFSILRERYHRQAVVHAPEFNYACFTPAEDVLSSQMMDLDLEVNEPYNLSALHGNGEKLQSDITPLLEYGNHSGTRKSLDFNLETKLQSDITPLQEYGNHSGTRKSLDFNLETMELKCQSEPIKVQLIVLSDAERSHVDTEAQTPTKIHDASNLPCASGGASPIFIVTTPATRERRRTRKRKLLFDDTIVLPNETLRKGIHDASSLVCKRGKAPHTALDSWKAYKLSNLPMSFMEPLVPCITLDAKYFDSSALKRFTIKSDDNQLDMFTKSPEHESSFVEKISVHTPASESYLETPTVNRLNKKRWEDSSSVEMFDSEMNVLDKEFSSLGENAQGQDGWSIRTRSVAQYICNSLRSQGAQEHVEILCMGKILEGEMKAKCARFFYEILVLKSQGCIEVKQEYPYDDIIISSTTQFKGSLTTQ